jgi:hypothetical protein
MNTSPIRKQNPQKMQLPVPEEECGAGKRRFFKPGAPPGNTQPRAAGLVEIGDMESMEPCLQRDDSPLFRHPVKSVVVDHERIIDGEPAPVI